MNLNCHDIHEYAGVSFTLTHTVLDRGCLWFSREPSILASPPLSSPDHVSESLGTQLPCRSSSPNGIGWYADHIPSLERDFCSDFTCCGQSLADLHKLVDHFEEAHVVVIGADGNAIYPRPERSTLSANTLHESPHASMSANAFSGIVVVGDMRISRSRTCTFPEAHLCRKVGDSINFDVFSGTRSNLTADQLCLPPSLFTSRTSSSNSGSCSPSRTERKRPRGVHGPYRRRDKLYKCPVSSLSQFTCAPVAGLKRLYDYFDPATTAPWMYKIVFEPKWIEISFGERHLQHWTAFLAGNEARRVNDEGMFGSEAVDEVVRGLL